MALLQTSLLILVEPSMGYDINGAKQFIYGDNVGIDATGDSRGGCIFQHTRRTSICCYSCACQGFPCACGPGLAKATHICDKSQSKHCRDNGFNVTRVDNSLCVLFLDDSKRRDLGRYEVTMIGDQNQTVPITVRSGNNKERVEDGLLVKAAINSDILLSASFCSQAKIKKSIAASR